uniref:Uncharacterized protein n=1 Tax=Anopheles quadriannulatus TaxID=34691 RepID=A0A182XTL7_ANOQN
MFASGPLGVQLPSTTSCILAHLVARNGTELVMDSAYLSHRRTATQQTTIGHDHLHIPTIGRRNGIRLSKRKQWPSRIECNNRVHAPILTLSGIAGNVSTQTEPNHVHIVRGSTGSNQLIDKRSYRRTCRPDSIAGRNVVRVHSTSTPVDADHVVVTDAEIPIADVRVHAIISVAVPAVNGEAGRMGRVKVGRRNRAGIAKLQHLRCGWVRAGKQPEDQVLLWDKVWNERIVGQSVRVGIDEMQPAIAVRHEMPVGVIHREGRNEKQLRSKQHKGCTNHVIRMGDVIVDLNRSTSTTATTASFENYLTLGKRRVTVGGDDEHAIYTTALVRRFTTHVSIARWRTLSRHNLAMASATCRTETNSCRNRFRVQFVSARVGTVTGHIDTTARLRATSVRVEVSIGQRQIETQQTGIGEDGFRVLSVARCHNIRIRKREQRSCRIQTDDRVQLPVLHLARIASRMRTQAMSDQPWMVKRVGCEATKLEFCTEAGLFHCSTWPWAGLRRVNRRKITSVSGVNRGSISLSPSGISYGLVLIKRNRPDSSGTNFQLSAAYAKSKRRY